MHPWEERPASRPGTHLNDGTHPLLKLLGLTSRQRGLVGEALTKQRLLDDGWHLFRNGDQTQIEIPGQKTLLGRQKYFVPDFIAAKDGKLMLVESKTGLGAKFTDLQQSGYKTYQGTGQALKARSAAREVQLQDWLAARGLNGDVTSVQVDRWNTEIVPDLGLVLKVADANLVH